MPTRFTRNQSYDLRGDPFPIRFNPNLSPWNMSSWGYPYSYFGPRRYAAAAAYPYNGYHKNMRNFGYGVPAVYY